MAKAARLPLKKHLLTLLLPAAALLVYAYLADSLNFTQDDAYISYRYVANFLSGHGLVYNVGERIEGYTNFGWVIYLILWGSSGLGFIAISKVTGFIFGAGVIVITFMCARHIFTGKDRFFAWLPVLLVAFNQSLAYWSPAGLETAAFSFFAFLSMYLFLTRNRVLILSLTMATLLRPEGALVAAMLIAIEAIERRTWPRFSLQCAAMAAIFLLPLAVFKIVYYGSLFPNPFFAKTALSVDKILDGLEYAGRFLKHYGFYGIGLMIPLLFHRKLPASVRVIWLFTVFYSVYIIVVGGDVLKVHRFFLPLIGPSAILLAVSLQLMVRRYSDGTRYLALFVVGILLLVTTVALPRAYVKEYNVLEKYFTDKMKFMAEHLKQTDQTDFSVALPTIGIFGYELGEHRIIDMLGLTDSTVARHPQEPISGMTSTWKEQKFNAEYILRQGPDYIMFSTGIKPSAPAEKALFLYREFLDHYRLIGFAHSKGPGQRQVAIRSIYKRFGDVDSNLVATHPVEFAEIYKLGLESQLSGDPRRAIQYYQKAMNIGPRPVYAYLLYGMAECYSLMRDSENARTLYDATIARDSLVFMAHAAMYRHTMLVKDTAKAAIHWRCLEKTVPWLLPRLEAETLEMLRRAGSTGR